MNLQEIRVSGLLELYVMGALDKADEKIVKESIAEHPQLAQDLAFISESLQAYTRLSTIAVPPQAKSQLLDTLEEVQIAPATKRTPRPSAPSKKAKSNAPINIPIWPIISGLLLLGLIGLWYLMSQRSNAGIAEQQSIISEKDERITALEKELASKEAPIAMLNRLTGEDNRIMKLRPNRAFSEMEVYLHSNIKADEYFLHIHHLKALEEGQYYAIWIDNGDRTFSFAERLNPDQVETFKQITISDSDRYLVTIEEDTISKPTLRNVIGYIE